MKFPNINLLLIEDDLVDQLAFGRAEKENPFFNSFRIAGSLKAAKEYLDTGGIDVIVCDYMLGDGNAFDVLAIARDIPVIIITGAGNEEVAIKAFRMGAFDYLIKDNARNYLKLLPFTIQNALKRRDTEKEVRKLSLVAGKCNNAIIITDKHGKIEWVNAGFTKLSGYEPHEVTGTSGEMLRKEGETGLRELYRDMILNRKTISYEARNYSKDGREYWVLTTLTPLLDQQGNIENIIAIDADITERKLAEQVILAAGEARLAEESFVADTGPEIRTPMKDIVETIDLLLHSQLSDQQRAHLEIIRTSAGTLSRTLNDILDYSRSRTGEIAPESAGLKTTDPRELKFPRKLNILVVEDNLINQKLLKNTLVELGATLTITGNGKTAVDILRSNEPFDLILMDLKMPEMDGFQTTRYIRTVLPSPANSTPIIAVTASALSTEKENCLAIGMNDYITKPFTKESVYEKTLNIIFPELAKARTQEIPLPQKLIRLSNLQQFQRNGKNFVAEIIAIFLEESPRDMEGIRNAFTIQDWKTVEQISHRVAPSAAMVGLDALYETLVVVEQKAMDQDIASLVALLDKMELLYKKAVLDLSHYMKEDSPL